MTNNFVDIVGYQLEKVHTGAIAWLLDTQRSPLPIGEIISILHKLAPRLSNLDRLVSVKAYREFAFSRRRRMDLVIEITAENKSKEFILIECKVDTDVNITQLQESSRLFASKNPNNHYQLIVLALGAGQFTLKHLLQQIMVEGFHAVDLPESLELFSNLSIAGKVGLYDEWIASLHAENERQNRIEMALAGIENPWDNRLIESGYRFGFPIFYAFYNKMREYLEEGPFNFWSIYSGSNNPVMNWDNGLVKVEHNNNSIRLYWEFNWDAFCLKAEIKKEDVEYWKQIRPSIIGLCRTCSIAGRQTADKSGTSVTAYKWNNNLCKDKPEEIATKTISILSQIHHKLFLIAQPADQLDDVK